MTLSHFVQFLNHGFAGALVLGVMCALSSGCHRRGYSDLYLEAMATEVRELEDQLYEYDHEYKLLEQELESLRRQNAALKQASPNERSSSDSSTSRKQLQVPGELPAPKRQTSPSQQSLIPKLIEPSEDLPKGNRPELPNSGLEIIEPAPSESSSPRRLSVPPSEPDDFNIEELSIPSIITGSKSPPALMLGNPSTAPESNLEMSLSQIELPSQLASASTGAAILPATQVVTDKKVVELAFHPTLTRSVNFDHDERDDGLFLVLQPKNASGQFVNVSAALTVEILDPAREEDQARIGFWKYSPSEVSSKVQPIGSQQGIHLTLPWNGPNPKADRVVVFVTYTFENGRQVIARREIFVQGPGTLKTVWAPRAPGNHAGRNPSNSLNVLPASGVRDSSPSFLPVTASSTFPAAEPAPQP